MTRIDRRQLIHGTCAAALTAAATSIVGCQSGEQTVQDTPNHSGSERMPVLFIGHGSPMNAIEDNAWSRGFRAIGQSLPHPKAVLAISAHWWTEGSLLTGNESPRTIHDFGGFPEPLYEIQYPAPGSPRLAQRVTELVADAEPNHEWGLDHGTWSVTKYLFPNADVPIVQLSLNSRLTPRQHFELARDLAELRGEGILILGSGNLTHNLRDAMSRASSANPEVPDWASEFDRTTSQAILERDSEHLIRAWPDGPSAKLVHPHPDHWFPLLYAYSASDPADEVSFPIEGFSLGSLSMRAVRWG